MNVNKLAYVKEAKYLGVIICNDLKDDGDILRHLRNFYDRSNSIIRTFHHCSVGVKLHLFRIVVQFIAANYGLTLIRALI